MKVVVTGIRAIYAAGMVVWGYCQYLFGSEKPGIGKHCLEGAGKETYVPTTGYFGDNRYYYMRLLIIRMIASPLHGSRW